METIYYILTENRFNQILLFKSYDDACIWASKATRWTAEEIKRNIKKSVKIGDMLSIFAE